MNIQRLTIGEAQLIDIGCSNMVDKVGRCGEVDVRPCREAGGARHIRFAQYQIVGVNGR